MFEFVILKSLNKKSFEQDLEEYSKEGYEIIWESFKVIYSEKQALTEYFVVAKRFKVHPTASSTEEW